MGNSIAANNPNAIRDVLFKLNTDDRFRSDFLNDPIRILQQQGITLDPTVQAEVISFVTAFKQNLGPNARIPAGTKNLAAGAPNADDAVQQLAIKWCMG